MVRTVFIVAVLEKKEYVYLVHTDLLIITVSLKLRCVRWVGISIIIQDYLPSFFPKNYCSHYPKYVLHGIKFYFQDWNKYFRTGRDITRLNSKYYRPDLDPRTYIRIQGKHPTCSKWAFYLGKTSWPDSPKLTNVLMTNSLNMLSSLHVPS